ncbi:MAG: tetratricopeptide repeat protein [Amylibacter sp.]
MLGFVDNLDRCLGAAIDKFKTSLQMNPNHAEITIRLALALVFNRQLKEAKEVLRYRPDFTISEWVKSQMYE